MRYRHDNLTDHHHVEDGAYEPMDEELLPSTCSALQDTCPSFRTLNDSSGLRNDSLADRSTVQESRGAERRAGRNHQTKNVAQLPINIASADAYSRASV